MAPEVHSALKEGQPVLCLESAVVTHGLPSPVNGQAVWRCARVARELGVVTATVGVLDGVVKVGLTDDELRRLADPDTEVVKIGVRDLAPAMVKKYTGGTTVSATAWIASRMGLRVVVTGAIGGVHRGFSNSLDVSSDLTVLGQAPVCIVSAGVKAVVDMEATAEWLELLAIPVVGLRCDQMPGFYYNDTGIPLANVVEDEADAARMFRAHRALERKGGFIVMNKVPEASALPKEEVEAAIESALAAAKRDGVKGKDVTPRLLDAVREKLGERAVAVNLDVLESNTKVAANLAIHVAREVPYREPGLEGA